MKIILSLGACFILALMGSAQTTIPGVFSTGVDDSGNPLSAGETDPHWTITTSPIGAVPALVAGTLNKNWAADTTSSAWINATGNGDDIEPVGLYVYTLTFSLDGFDASTAQIFGQWASDNQSQIFLNGNYTGFSNDTNGFKPLDLFSLKSGFVAGENELQFYVTQDPVTSGNDPEGLQVNILSATADPVPEPATLSLFALSILGIYLTKKQLLPLQRPKQLNPSQRGPRRFLHPSSRKKHRSRCSR